MINFAKAQKYIQFNIHEDLTCYISHREQSKFFDGGRASALSLHYWCSTFDLCNLHPFNSIEHMSFTEPSSSSIRNSLQSSIRNRAAAVCVYGVMVENFLLTQSHSSHLTWQRHHDYWTKRRERRMVKVYIRFCRLFSHRNIAILWDSSHEEETIFCADFNWLFMLAGMDGWMMMMQRKNGKINKRFFDW